MDVTSLSWQQHFLTLLGQQLLRTWSSWRESGIKVDAEQQWGRDSCSRSSSFHSVAQPVKVRQQSPAQLRGTFTSCSFNPNSIIPKVTVRIRICVDFSSRTCKIKCHWQRCRWDSNDSFLSKAVREYFKTKYTQSTASKSLNNHKLARVDSCSDASGLLNTSFRTERMLVSRFIGQSDWPERSKVKKKTLCLTQKKTMNPLKTKDKMNTTDQSWSLFAKPSPPYWALIGSSTH